MASDKRFPCLPHQRVVAKVDSLSDELMRVTCFLAKCLATATTDTTTPMGKKCEICERPNASKGYVFKEALRCAACALPDMVNVTNPRCASEGCVRQPSYGYGGSKPTHCSEHRESDMRDLKNGCRHPGCKMSKSYGRGKTAMFCAQHKEPDMYLVSAPMCPECKEAGVTKQASYGPMGGRPRFCASHAGEGDVNLVSFKCREASCSRMAYFGINSPEYCMTHKSAEMTDQRHATCNADGCNKRATRGPAGERPSFCADHAEEDMEDRVHGSCVVLECTRARNRHEKYRGHCLVCFEKNFPDEYGRKGGLQP